MLPLKMILLRAFIPASVASLAFSASCFGQSQFGTISSVVVTESGGPGCSNQSAYVPSVTTASAQCGIPITLGALFGQGSVSSNFNDLSVAGAAAAKGQSPSIVSSTARAEFKDILFFSGRALKNATVNFTLVLFATADAVGSGGGGGSVSFVKQVQAVLNVNGTQCLIDLTSNGNQECKVSVPLPVGDQIPIDVLLNGSSSTTLLPVSGPVAGIAIASGFIAKIFAITVQDQSGNFITDYGLVSASGTTYPHN